MPRKETGSSGGLGGPGGPVEGCALIVLDGLGDRPHPDLGGKTPLEAARTPWLDRLAAEGALGTVLTVGRGIAPESDAGVLGLLGYDPRTDSPGRGVLEAEGVGETIAPGEVAFRFNFATVRDGDAVQDSRVGRSLTTEEAGALARALTAADLLADQGVEARVLATVGHRGVVHFIDRKGPGISPEVSNADPFYERTGGMGRAVRPSDPHVLKVRALDDTPGAARCASLVNTFLARVPPILKEHPVNARRAASHQLLANHLLLRDAGTAPRELRPFRRRWGVEGAALTEMPVERGLAKLLELTDSFVGPIDPAHRAEGYRQRASLTQELLGRHPFVYVHLKGPDEPGHDGNARLKRDVVEALDADYVGPLLEGLDLSRHRLLITADHATPCILKGHSDDPVPVLVVGGPGFRPASTPSTPAKFSERSAEKGPLGLLSAHDLLGQLLPTRRA